MVEGVWLGWGARADVVSGSAGGGEVFGGAGREKDAGGCRQVIIGRRRGDGVRDRMGRFLQE